ncbi:MAG: helix-turn-helix transcriptional regulator, partial [Bryobacteraceae bacterium]
MDAKETTRLSAVVVESLDEEPVATEDLARRAWWSRSHFHRLFRALVEETPLAMRRRLLLERAAWQLGRTPSTVTEIALDAQYGSLEAFTRAFRRAFGISPSLYRRLGPTHFRLTSANGIHFCAPHSRSKGKSDMDLFDRFAGHDSWHTRRLLEHAATLTGAQLDQPLGTAVKVTPWEKPEHSLRDLLDRIVFTKEAWTAALAGRDMPSPASTAECSPAALLARYDKVDADFTRILREIRDTGG